MLPKARRALFSMLSPQALLALFHIAAVYELTGAQSERLGFRDRGILAPGYAGDLTIFDLDELAWEQDTFVSDLPSGGARLRRPPGGYRLTAVAGVVTQRDGELTGANPGRVLDGGAARPA